jgi:phosphatidylserine decarboxylase
VYGENIRTIVPIDTERFGRVIVVCVGAMMVGSTVITAKNGQKVKRTDELGYFKFGMTVRTPDSNDLGGSTVIVLFQPGTFVFDDDLISNSLSSLETLVRASYCITDIRFAWVKVLDITPVCLK